MFCVSKSVILCLLFLGTINAGEWHVNQESQNTVTFFSSTTLLDFEGTTNNIDGYVYWDGADLFSGKSEVYFEVQPATFKTGIGKRDRDMREDVLETEKFPLASFKGVFTKTQQSDSLFKVVVSGNMLLHGFEQSMDITGDIKISGDTMNINSSFSLLLNDYKIQAPSLMAFVKVAEEIKIELDINLKHIAQQ